jgi:Flp pilus assembly protein TadD
MAAAIALHLTAVLAVFVTERYRLTVVPGLLIFASLGLHRLWTESWLGNYRNVAIQLVVVAAGILFVTMPRNDPSLWALEAYNSGRLALDANNLSLAERDLQRAYAYVPDNAEISFALGNLRLAQGDSVAAKGFYETTLRLNQKHKGALNNLGVLALDGNQPAVAVDYLRHAVTQEPRNAKTHYLLAKALAASGNQSEARAEAARALELDSAQPEFKTLNDQLRRTER